MKIDVRKPDCSPQCADLSFGCDFEHDPSCRHYGRRKPPSARAEPRPRSWSYEDIKQAFEAAKGGES